MKGKQTRGRQKIENEDDRHIMISEQKSGIYKKACELTTLCGAEVGVVIFSPFGQPFSYDYPSIDSIANRLLNIIPPKKNDATHALVEAHRKMRLNKIIENQIELLNELKIEKQCDKRHVMMEKERSGVKGWWDIPIELFLEQLQQMHSSFQEIHDNLANHLILRSNEQPNLFPNPSEGPNAFGPNVDSSNYPHGGFNQDDDVHM